MEDYDLWYYLCDNCGPEFAYGEPSSDMMENFICQFGPTVVEESPDGHISSCDCCGYYGELPWKITEHFQGTPIN